MKNKFLLTFLLMTLILTQIVDVFGELQQFETEIEIHVDNQSIEIETEERTFTYTCGGTHSHSIDIDIARNISCSYKPILEENQQLIRMLSGGLNDSRKYYDKYLECYGQYSRCNERISQSNFSGVGVYLDEYTEAYENWKDCQSSLSTSNNAKSNAETQLATCLQEQEGATNEAPYWGIGGLILGAGGYWFLFVKRKESPAVSSAEQQLPKSR